MSKLTQIQNELLAINPAKFQQLSDLYLHKKGYTNINPIGLIIGAEKVAVGTPDSLVRLPNGKYLFSEDTTQKEEVFTKFKKDLSKCFDEAKTGIPVSEIEEIILCHTTELSTTEDHELTELCRRRGCRLTICGMGTISYDLYQQYPGLAKDFLGVEIDTHQIVVPKDFVVAYNKSSFATPLDTTFQFRDEELKGVVDALSQYDLVMIAGRAGVGKSRLALESCAQFVREHSEWKPWCIFNRGQNLYEDLQVYFSPDGYYLIVVDDANRINFDYVLQHLHNQTSRRRIKILATVRDYALEKVREKAAPYGNKWEVEIQPFTDEQISTLVTAQYNIHHPLYLERITSIATGNPRLALMAARIAIRENTLQSIHDVSQLYEEYFRSIRRDLASLDDKNIVQVAGIIAFFRTVDRSNEMLMQAIAQAFGISANEFWSAALHLHELEIVDMYENEVVRASDQVLSTYLFYLAFFREHLVSFEIILTHFFPAFSSRIIDVLNPVLSSFDAAAISEMIRPHVARRWSEIRETGSDSDILEFMRVFWFLDPTGNLRFLRDTINAVEPETIDWSEKLFVPDTQAQAAPILQALELFRYAAPETLRMAVELLLNYGEKRWADLPVILHILQSHFGYTHRSYHNRYAIEREVIAVLQRRLETGSPRIYPFLFCAIAEYFLRVHFHHHESRGQHAIQIYNFQLSSTSEMISLRKTIWQTLFALYREPEYRPHVLRVIHSYVGSNGEHGEADIVKHDANVLLPFLETSLDPQNYVHCLLVYDYCELLTRRHVHFSEELRQQFTSQTMTVAELLFDSLHDIVNMGHEEYYAKKRELLAAYCAEFETADYIGFLAQCEEILSVEHRQHNTFAFEQNITQVLIDLANRDAQAYSQLVSFILQRRNMMQLSPWPIVSQLVAAVGSDSAWDILTKYDYPRKHWWLFSFYIALPEETITPTHLIRLILLYKEAEPDDIPSNWQYLTAFQSLDEDIYARIVRLLLERTEENKRFGQVFVGLFEQRSISEGEIPRMLVEDLDLLKRAYFAAQAVGNYHDYSGTVFNRILDLDRTFVREYLWWMVNNYMWLLHHHHNRDYSFLWLRDDYELVMTEIVDTANSIAQEHRYYNEELLQGFFIRREGHDNIDIDARQKKFLENLIARHSQDMPLMQLVFDVVAHFGYEQRRVFIAEFVAHNKSVTDFQKLPLEPHSFGWTGSQVPMLEARVTYYQSLLPLFADIDLLDHRQEIEDCIQRLRANIEREKKHDFMED